MKMKKRKGKSEQQGTQHFKTKWRRSWQIKSKNCYQVDGRESSQRPGKGENNLDTNEKSCKKSGKCPLD